MNDCFVLSEKRTGINDLKNLLAKVPECRIEASESSGMIQTWYKDKHIDFTLMSLPEFESEADKRCIEEKCIESVILVSCAVQSESARDELLSLLAEAIPVMIGQDADGFAPIKMLCRGRH